MDAKELRIGNLVESYHGGKPVMVKELKYHYKHLTIFTEPDSIGSVNGMVLPIPLTEEWLLKFGFEKGKQNIDRNVFYLERIQYGNGLVMFKDNLLDTRIEHVHTLQNLYFALTGEELEIVDV